MTEHRFGKQVLLVALLIASACSSGDTNSGARPATTPDAGTDDGGNAAAGASAAGGTSGQGGSGAGAGGAGSGAGAGGGGTGGSGAGGAGTSGTGGTSGVAGSAPQSCTLDDDCDDEDPCTDGHCDDDACSYTNNQASCDDDDTCTENDQCNSGQCAGEPLCNDACSDLNAASCMDIAITPVAAGGTHSCGRRESGAIRCWGSNANFALGYPPSSNTADDVDVGGSVLKIALGPTHSCALLEGGGVRCWGSALFSQLGYPGEGTITDEAAETPASVGDVALGGAAIDVDAGDRHTCVVRAGGDVLCWGDGERGKLGYGNTESIGDGETPASVGAVELGGSARQVVTGYNHSCALLTTGRVRCWGWGTSGVLGNALGGTVGDNETPASQPVLELGGNAVQLSAGRAHTCALLEDQSLRCWGLGSEGALGYGSTQNVGDDETPAARGAVDVGGAVIQISAGGDHTCALLADQSVRCWGRGTNGQLGYGNTDNIGDNETPGSLQDPVDVGGAVTFIDAGASHTCAALASGSLRCWGDGFGNKLGYGNTEAIGDNEHPASAGDIAW